MLTIVTNALLNLLEKELVKYEPAVQAILMTQVSNAIEVAKAWIDKKSNPVNITTPTI
jgi:hypothetical protein